MHAQKPLVCGLAASPLALGLSSKQQVACTTAAIPRPVLSGAEILDISAVEYHNQTVLSSFGSFPANLTVSYCGVNMYVTMVYVFRAIADLEQLIHAFRME